MADMLIDGPFDPRDWMSPEELAETAHLFKDSPMILTEDIETPEFLWSTGRQREMVNKYEELTSKLLPPLPEKTAEDHLLNIVNAYNDCIRGFMWGGTDVSPLEKALSDASKWMNVPIVKYNFSARTYDAVPRWNGTYEIC